MKRKLVLTADGSSSIFIPGMEESYHSMHGALQEAQHVFIDNGLANVTGTKLRIFELGFGTGLNALLSLDYGITNKTEIRYDAIEAHPVTNEIIEQLNYTRLIEKDYNDAFANFHNSKWEENIRVHKNFTLRKINCRIQDYEVRKKSYHIIYFDAFGPKAQPEMWIPDVLAKMYEALTKDGVLITYCAQGQFRRDLKAIGFKVEKLKGPPGKREMTRAIK